MPLPTQIHFIVGKPGLQKEELMKTLKAKPRLWFNQVAQGYTCAQIAKREKCSKGYVRDCVVRYFNQRHPELYSEIACSPRSAWPGFLACIRDLYTSGRI